MQGDFSLERECEKIHSSETRELFQEVLSSYWGRNYRGCIVTLWTVVVYDLLIKMRSLHLDFNDTAAEGILQRVASLQQSNPKSSDWEHLLIKDIGSKTKLLQPHEVQHLIEIQKTRHICAHPVINSNVLDPESISLYKPDQDRTRAHIRLALEAVLIKPPLASRKIFKTLMEDIEDSQDILISNDRLWSYIYAKYIRYLSDAEEAAVYRSLWKMAFTVENTRADGVRSTNCRLLCALHSRNQPICMSQIMGETKFYSNISKRDDVVYELFLFLARFPDVHTCLEDHAKVILEGFTQNNKDIEAVAWFLKSSTIGEQITKLEADLDRYRVVIPGSSWSYGAGQDPVLSPKALSILIASAQESGFTEKALRIASKAYGESSNYDTADLIFSSCLRPNLSQFSASDFQVMLEGIEGNPQTYKRGAAQRDHKILQGAMINVPGGSFDWSKYPNFTGSIGV